MTQETGFVSRPGIVDKVAAVRKSGEVIRLDVTVRVETEFAQTYYTEDKHIDEMRFSMPADSQVNPGDVVSVNMQFASPFGARFQPALEASTSDDDVLDVEVEAGMVEEVKLEDAGDVPLGNKTECGDDDCKLVDCQLEEDDDDS